MSQACMSQQQLVAQLVALLVADILKLAALEQVPDPFLRIELGA